MIDKLTNEINIALDNKLYLTALTATLTLPDVCGKAEYPNSGTKKRYTDWYKKYVPDASIPAETVYKLRCSLLHEGNIDSESKNNVKFHLMTNEYTHPLGLEFCFKSNIKHADGSSEEKITVYVGFLCTMICNAAMEYYKANKEKFSFLNYEIIDLSSRIKL